MHEEEPHDFVGDKIILSIGLSALFIPFFCAFCCICFDKISTRRNRLNDLELNDSDELDKLPNYNDIHNDIGLNDLDTPSYYSN